MRLPERSLEPPASSEFFCPVCGAESPEHIFAAPGEGAVGCSECLCCYKPEDYFEALRGDVI